WMLFTLRSFALAELEASDDREAVHRAHAFHVLDLTETAADAFRNLPTAHQAQWFMVIESGRGNWRAALSWLHEQGETSLLLRLTTSLAWFWYVRGPMAEGRFWLERALAMNPQHADVRDRIPALMGGGMLAHYSGDGAAAREMLEACLMLEHEAPNNWWRASALWVLGMVERTAGNYTIAEAHLREALAAYRALPHETNAAIILGQLGAAAWGSGDTERARVLCAEGIALQRQSGDRWGLGNTLGYSGLIALDLGDATTAARALQESLHIRAEETRSNPIDLLDTDTQPHWQAGAWYDVAGSLSNLAVLASFLGDHEAAAKLFGASGALRKLVGRTEPMLPARTVYIRAENTSRQHLGADRYAEVFGSGAALSGPEALIDALATADRLVESTEGAGTPR
ncbi:MAG TPA: tetratricopeptide repeat protein, partial [Thermomicrobiales bacterium]|nr:tetratricopeptide repeat protein [Thermomicrobiales bacterium]